MLKKKHEPIRLCIACRKKDFKYNLLRVVKNKSGYIFVDYSKKASGRGSYVCSCEKCVKILRKKKSLQKMFKCVVKDEIYLELESRVGML